MNVVKPSFSHGRKQAARPLVKSAKKALVKQTDHEFVEKCRSLTDQMLDALVQIALQADGNAAARVAAAKTVLEMGHGKAIPSAVAPGKKEQKKIDAQTNEVGSPWEDLLN